MWVNATFNKSNSTGVIYNRFCPVYYCKYGNKTINIGDDPSKQCAFNRTGVLCGACMGNFSLAIGSSRCIKCPNNHNVALLLAFAAGGVFLVLFILALDLTVTQGLINGVIFYANIVWAYKIVLLPIEMQENNWLFFLQIFVAWLNLDFGIESCFLNLLDWMFIGRHGYSFYSHSTSGSLLVLSLLLAATPLASLILLVAELFLF